VCAYREEDSQPDAVGRDEYGFDLERKCSEAYSEWQKKYDKQDRYVASSVNACAAAITKSLTHM
jgi:hypothetical protein